MAVDFWTRASADSSPDEQIRALALLLDQVKEERKVPVIDSDLLRAKQKLAVAVEDYWNDAGGGPDPLVEAIDKLIRLRVGS